MLKGKRVVLLGGSSGFGLATAKAVANDGADVVIVSSKRAKVDAAVASLSGASAEAKAEGLVVDLGREDDIRALFERIGPFDHLVYTAGEPIELGPLSSLALVDARRFFELRFWGAYAAAKYAARFIRPGGSIALTSGSASQRPSAGWSVAASICGAMEALTRALAVELAPIRVNAIAAGVVKTDLWSSLSEADRTSLYEKTGAALLTRRVGEADDIGQAFRYLLTNGYVSGTTLAVDGGGMLV